ncbi:hypothetical protein [Saccharopolyspora sp. NPDC050642]|uniref:hypothetical protein n=1 Tax=Saccharopolyspora sp. NPDC050642 TaxID=3157099 RepID=UPI0033EF6A1C
MDDDESGGEDRESGWDGTVVKLAAPEEPLVCRFSADDCRMAVTAEATSAHPVGPSTATLSWRVLTALADSVTTEVLRPAHRRPFVRIEMTKEVDTVIPSPKPAEVSTTRCSRYSSHAHLRARRQPREASVLEL